MKKFFKEEFKAYGVKTYELHKIAKDLIIDLQSYDKDKIFELCDLLWKSRIHEQSIIACDLCHSRQKEYTENDFELFDYWINNYITNWANCDTFCNHSVGDFVMMYPQYILRLKEYAKSNKRWVKRASAVSLIIPARKEFFHDEIFEIAEILLTDKDDLVRKAYGWMLKACSESDQKRVFNFVKKHKSIMPRVSLRYAIEKMPPELKKEAMSKF
jgi:3-methyladenine DNA glycosylase AlkD